MTTPCPTCDHVHANRDVMALSRFTGIYGYRTADGVIHESREAAQAWLCAQRFASGLREVTP